METILFIFFSIIISSIILLFIRILIKKIDQPEIFHKKILLLSFIGIFITLFGVFLTNYTNIIIDNNNNPFFIFKNNASASSLEKYNEKIESSTTDYLFLIDISESNISDVTELNWFDNEQRILKELGFITDEKSIKKNDFYPILLSIADLLNNRNESIDKFAIGLFCAKLEAVFPKSFADSENPFIENNENNRKEIIRTDIKKYIENSDQTKTNFIQLFETLDSTTFRKYKKHITDYSKRDLALYIYSDFIHDRLSPEETQNDKVSIFTNLSNLQNYNFQTIAAISYNKRVRRLNNNETDILPMLDSIFVSEKLHKFDFTSSNFLTDFLTENYQLFSSKRLELYFADENDIESKSNIKILEKGKYSFSLVCKDKYNNLNDILKGFSIKETGKDDQLHFYLNRVQSYDLKKNMEISICYEGQLQKNIDRHLLVEFPPDVAEYSLLIPIKFTKTIPHWLKYFFSALMFSILFLLVILMWDKAFTFYFSD